MIRTRAEAKAYLSVFEQTSPGAFALARVLSLAARVEPELLRAARLRLHPQLNAGDEADLWCSDCVESSGPLWALFAPAIAEELRSNLAIHGVSDTARRAKDLIATMHAAAAPLVKLEETVHWLSLKGLGNRVKIEAELQPVLKAVREQNDEGVAQWAAHAVPRFSSWVRDLPIALAIRIVAEQRIGGTVAIDPDSEALSEESAAMLRDLLPTTEIWVRLTGKALEISLDRLLGGHAIAVPATDPITLTITDANRSLNVQLQKALQRIAVRDQVTIRSMTGTTWQLLSSDSTPRSHVNFRFFSAAEVDLEARRELGVIHVAFLIESKRAMMESITEPSLRDFGEFPRLDELPAPLVVLVSDPRRDSKGWEQIEVEQRRRLGSHPFIPGRRRGDFAVTIEVEGALVGIIGLNTSAQGVGLKASLDQGQLLEVCGGPTEEWIARHHVAILVLPDLEELMKVNPSTIKTIGALGFAFFVYRSQNPIKLRDNPPVVSLSGAPIVGDLSIGTESQLIIRQGSSWSHTRPVQARLHPVPIEIPDPEHWVLVTGSSYNFDEPVADVAQSIGHELVRNGFGLLTGGWDGVDLITTRAYAEALKARGVRDVSRFVRHILGTIEPRPEIPGARLLYNDGDIAGAESVRRSDAVVLIGGRKSATWMGKEAIRQKKLLIPITQTGGAAQSFPPSNDQALPGAKEPNAIARAAVAVVSRKVSGQESDDVMPAPRKTSGKRTTSKKPKPQVKAAGSMSGSHRKKRLGSSKTASRSWFASGRNKRSSSRPKMK